MKIVVLAGGISTERDVSLSSGRGVYNALKERGHQVILLDVFLGYEGDPGNIFELDRDWVKDVAPVSEVAPDIDKIKASRKKPSNILFGDHVIEICQMADIVFMALHGDCGENGKVQAVFDLVHLLLPFLGEPRLRRRAAQHQRHTRALVDLNARGARHTVAAAAAELAAKLPAVALDRCAALVRQLRTLADALQKLIQLALPLHAPDGHHIFLHRHPGRRGQAVAEQAAGHALHRDKAHAVRAAALDQCELLFPGKIAERELQRGV